MHHMVTKTPEESAALALKSGCDVNCGITYLHLLKAYEQGMITEEEIPRQRNGFYHQVFAGLLW